LFYFNGLIFSSIFCIVCKMNTQILRINFDNIDTDALREAGRLVDAGHLVAFPTETVYGIACRAANEPIARLNQLKSRTHEKTYTLHIGRLLDLRKYIPEPGIRAEKIIKNFWPGPLTIVFELNEKDIHMQKKKIDDEIFRILYHSNSIGIRFPDNLIACSFLNYIKNPVVAPSANITGGNPAVNAERVLSYFSKKIPLIIDGGTCKYKKNSTVVKIGKKGLQILRQGVYSAEEIEQKSVVNFLFVCTGNSCRSPMAEGFCRKYLAEKLNCTVDQVEKMGYKVISAGTMGISGLPASFEAVAVCNAKGIDISQHKSTALTNELIENSDSIFVMSQEHRRYVLELVPQAKEKCFLLGKDIEIADPIGQGEKIYCECAQVIEKAVKERIEEYRI